MFACMPLFVFMGSVAHYSGLTERLYSGVSKWTGILPGGLLHSNIVSCSLFAAICGSSIAEAATMGKVAYPEQNARGYSRGLITGSLAAGGTLGILIPPSVTMIIYAAFVGASVGRLFMGGVIPGILLAGFFMAFIGIRVMLTPTLAEPREGVTWRYFFGAISAFKEVWPVLVIMLTIFIGIYGGMFTPTEAAAVSSIEVVILAALFIKSNVGAVVKKAAIEALQITCMCMLCIVGARTLGYALGMTKVPEQLCEWVVALGVNRLVVWAAITVIYLILGCFIDGVSIMLLTLPVIYPLLIDTLGFDPIWLGIVITLLIEAALITPPVGMNVYIIHGISGGTDVWQVFKGVMPFFICVLLMLALLTFVPELALWLPSLMMGH